MKKINFKFLVVALLANTAILSNVWAARILISDADQTVSLTRALDCYSAADITIDTSRPEIYEPGSKQLQLVSDSVRAMLNYECPNLSEINITGLIRGLDDVVYEGKLTQRDSWLVQATASTASHSNQNNAWVPRESTNWRTTQRDHDQLSDQLAVTNLALGMTVAEVLEIVADTFDVEPDYDTENGLMTMLSGGCPANFDANVGAEIAQADWKCLKAWFSDNRIARLERLELVQVVKTNTDKVQQLLVEKYGRPSEQKTTRYDNKAQLVWRAADENTVAGNESVQSLSAELSEIEADLVVTNLTLFRQAVDQNKSVNYADVDLRL